MIEMLNEGEAMIQYEMTVAVAQYENLKPKVVIKCKANEIEQKLAEARGLLKEEYKKIKGKKDDNKN